MQNIKIYHKKWENKKLFQKHRYVQFVLKENQLVTKYNILNIIVHREQNLNQFIKISCEMYEM